MQPTLTIGLLFLGLISARAQHVCPDPDNILPCVCNIQISGINVFCHKVNLEDVQNAVSKIPDTQPILTLSITDSDIQSLPEKALGNRDSINLNTFRMHHCGLSSISDTAFENVPNLQHVNLVDNELTEIPIHPWLNKNSPGLQSLDLSKNKITEVSPGIFLDFNSTMTAYNLQTLRLSNNLLTELKKDAFLGLDKLQTLELWLNQITSIDSETWTTDLSSLSALYLDGNLLSKVEKAVFSDKLSLTHLHLSGNKITELEAQAIPNDVTNLNLRNNEIQSLPRNCFFRNNGLRNLDFSSNKLEVLTKEIFNVSRLSLIPPLKTSNFYLHNNLINSIGDDTFENMPFLWILHLQFNNLSRITENMFRHAQTIGDLHLSSNNIQKIEENAFAEQQWMKNLFLGHNRLNKISNASFNGLRDVQFLNVDHNSLADVDEVSLGSLMRLFAVKLNDNKLTKLPDKLFEASDRAIEWLWLENNELDDNSWPAIHSLERVRMLNLENNKFSNIPEEAFRETEVLNDLYLGGNNITFIGEHAFLSHRHIDLRHNALQLINENIFVDGHVPELLELEGNPLHCDCNIRWLTSGEWEIEDAVCATPQVHAGSSLTDIEPDELRCIAANVEISNIELGENFIHLHWVVDDDRFVKSYQVRYKEYTNEEDILIQGIDNQDYMIKDLKKATLYTCCVGALVEALHGDEISSEVCLHAVTRDKDLECSRSSMLSYHFMSTLILLAIILFI